MTLYVAFIATLNLCLGFALGAYWWPCPQCEKRRSKRLREAARAADSIQAPATKVSSIDSASVDVGNEPSTDQPLSAIEQVTEETVPEPAIDPDTGLVTREYVDSLLQKVSSGRQPRLTAALIEVDNPELGMEERLLRGVATTVLKLLSDSQKAARFTDNQVLLLLPQEDVERATGQAERVRQHVAATEYLADGTPIQTTVTCALAEVSDERSVEHLFDWLEEALGEAQRFGGNRTFSHDGISPAPVVPPELNVATQQCAI